MHKVILTVSIDEQERAEIAADVTEVLLTTTDQYHHPIQEELEMIKLLANQFISLDLRMVFDD